MAYCSKCPRSPMSHKTPKKPFLPLSKHIWLSKHMWHQGATVFRKRPSAEKLKQPYNSLFLASLFWTILNGETIRSTLVRAEIRVPGLEQGLGLGCIALPTASCTLCSSSDRWLAPPLQPDQTWWCWVRDQWRIRRVPPPAGLVPP